MTADILDLTKKLDSSKVIKQVLDLIRTSKLNITYDKALQREISSLFDENGIEHEAEFRLSDADIVDFKLSNGVFIECKLRQQKRAVFRQLERYAEHEQVKAIILVTNTAMGLPQKIKDKPAYYCSLGAAWI